MGGSAYSPSARYKNQPNKVTGACHAGQGEVFETKKGLRSTLNALSLSLSINESKKRLGIEGLISEQCYCTFRRAELEARFWIV